MDVSVLLWIVLAAIAISVAMGAKFKFNVGIFGFAFAYLIAIPLLGGSTKDVAAAFPTSLFLQMLLIPAFFSFSVKNGTLKLLASKILYRFRKMPILIPFAFLLIGLILGIFGSGAPTNNVVLSVMVFSVGLAMGLSPWLCLVMIVYGANLGTFAPWASYGVMVSRIGDEWMPGRGTEMTSKMMLAWILFTLVLFLIIWVMTKAFRLKAATMEEPGAFDATQKKCLALICAYVVLLLAPILLTMALPKVAVIKTVKSWMQPELLAAVGIAVSLLLKAGTQKQLLAEGFAWASTLQVVGMCTLLNIAKNAGVTDYLGSLMSENVSPLLMPVVLCIMGGFLSFFAGAIATVTPMLAAIAVPYAQNAGIDPIPLMLAVMMGASATAISPFSSGGAFVLSMCPNDDLRNNLFPKCLVLAFTGLALCCVFSLTVCKII